MEDRDLAAAAAKGDQEAFTSLVERHRVFIYAIAYKIALHEDDALDITQNVMLRLVEKIGRYRGEGPFRAWLATLASHEAINFLSRSGHRTERPTPAEDLEEMAAEAAGATAPRDDPREALDRAQRRRLVEAAMTRLSPQQRAIFVLRYREDMWPRDIAKRLGLPARQVRSQLHRAIARLREIVAGQDAGGASRKKRGEPT